MSSSGENLIIIRLHYSSALALPSKSHNEHKNLCWQADQETKYKVGPHKMLGHVGNEIQLIEQDIFPVSPFLSGCKNIRCLIATLTVMSSLLHGRS